MKKTLSVMLSAVIMAAFFCQAADTIITDPAKVDMDRRTKELQELGFGMFICWSFSTFSGKEWTPGIQDVSFFKASEVDTDQWAKTAKEAGMGYILFLTKHHDGFCMWDTRTTDRKITKAPLGKDVLSLLKQSCDKYGIKLALYFSEGEWAWPDKPTGGRYDHNGGHNPEMKKAQLKEILTQFGPIEYIWFDHAVGDGGLSHEETVRFCKSLQPGCFIGFNNGAAAGDIRLGEMGHPAPLDDVTGAGFSHRFMKDYKGYRLAEFTYPILPDHKGGAMWFYSLPEHDNLCKPAEDIYKDYLGAKKYGNVFALDVGPDYKGRIREIDVKTLRKVGEMIRNKAPVPETGSAVKTQIDWPGFIARHDMIWDAMPRQFDYGAFLGNGMLGATVYQDGDNQIRFEMGRADVTEHRRDNARLPIGGLVLTTAGKISSGNMRLDLWNAEVRGTVTTDKGTINFRSFIHTDQMAVIIDLEPEEGERGSSVAWKPAKCQDHRNLKRFNDPPNPPERMETIDGMQVCIQERFAGGEFATAWTENRTDKGRRVILGIEDSFPGKSAGADVVKTAREVAAVAPEALLASHRKWWHEFYQKNFVSIPDAKLESFYWIQWYKLASASRPDRVPVDLLGPWYRDTSWPRIWWNLNIETLYLPVYTGNRLELGESFINFIDRKRDNFFRNARDIWKFDDCATVPHTTCYEGLRGDGSCAPDKYINPGDFTWALHNYYLHYRYSMDHAMVTDQSKHAFYPLLKGSINLYLKILKKGDDGKLHLPVLHSPEYGEAADNNYNLSLLRWGCQTLIQLNKRYKLNDPMVETWERTLKDLVPYPVDDNGLSVGANTPFARPHRHWSHMLMVHPLHVMDFDDPANRELITRSIRHWLKTGDTKGGDGIFGWSRAAAASLCASLGDGDNALKMIHGHMADGRFVRPNTMYIEGSPVIECSIVLNRSLQDMLLQSWGDKINVFPAVPATWKDAVFHDLRAEGAFLVSASRRDGRTEWIRIKSLAGEPCRLQAGFAGEPKLKVNGKPEILKPSANGIYDLPLETGDEAFLCIGGLTEPVVRPIKMTSEESNQWGGRAK